MSVKREDYQALRDAFAGLKQEYNEEPPAGLEALLVAQVRRRRHLRRARMWGAMTAAAVLILLALTSAGRRRASLPVTPSLRVSVERDAPVPDSPVSIPETAAESTIPTVHHPRGARRQAPRMNVAAEDAFVAIPYAEPLDPSEQVDIYRVELPRVTLAHFGLPVRIGSVDSPVTADIAVGSDGVARAIRFVH